MGGYAAFAFARLETVAAAGHTAAVERPDAVAGALRRFLEELPALEP